VVVILAVAVTVALFTDRVLATAVATSYALVQWAYRRRGRPLYLVVIVGAVALAATVTLIGLAASGAFGT
jgi:hypothetical protein